MWLLTYLEKMFVLLICMYLHFDSLEGCYEAASGLLLFLIMSCEIEYFNKYIVAFTLPPCCGRERGQPCQDGQCLCRLQPLAASLPSLQVEH